MAVYTLMPEERIVAMMEYQGRMLIATTHRLFEMKEVAGPEPWPGGAGSTLEIKPILMEAKDANAED